MAKYFLIAGRVDPFLSFNDLIAVVTITEVDGWDSVGPHGLLTVKACLIGDDFGNTVGDDDAEEAIEEIGEHCGEAIEHAGEETGEHSGEVIVPIVDAADESSDSVMSMKIGL